ncbi:UvrD-helicase domain-containing protein [Comamonas sp.]|uniref:UvrD-helicase domain-containing protein n=1 Tax=Comamonas sp. TaxID=34028 RepID=UPI0012CF8B3E|nr:UvrD-helicase domain-containing protein [Comamonas sp.]MPT13024.1 ATP-dependent DNA helicase [Comamonas sp.]
MSALTPEQQAVVDAPMEPLCVIACAGSGKTKTAVQRLVQMRRSLGNTRGRVALLSFSNVAVDTFRKAYDVLARDLPTGVGRDRVEIDTLDGFITSNILRPHGHRTMGASQAAYLVTGSETFLSGFTFKTPSFPMRITELHVAFVKGQECFYYRRNDELELVANAAARDLIGRLGKTGAYTHDLGRYWVYRALKERPELLKVVVRRYPHILIDEAQDIGSVHQAILLLLIDAGACVTLIGDPNQGIYDFAGADGKFLSEYHERPGVLQYSLKRNFRSVPRIVSLANGLCGRDDVAERGAPATPHGAYFTGYKRDQHVKLITAFQGALAVAGADLKRSAVLCRGRGLTEAIRGDAAPAGQGSVKVFATAAVLRDQKNDFQNAFQRVAIGVAALLDKPPHGLVSCITQAGASPAQFPRARALRREIWIFTRDAKAGLPSAFLTADTQWHSQLVANVRILLNKLQTEFGLTPAANIGLKLKKTGLPNAALLGTKDLADEKAAPLRIDTVHQAKGESLDAVLYMTLKDHAQELLAGVGTEVGRIGYVASTRARDLLWVAVPSNALNDLRPLFEAKGFQEVD